MSIRYAVAIALLMLQFGNAVHADDKPTTWEKVKKPVIDEKVPEPILIGLDGMPVIYKDSAVVVRNKDGIAAIVFDKPIEKAVTYRYRFLPNGQNKEQAGEGKVFEKNKKVWSFSAFRYFEFVYNNNEGKTSIDAGPISLSWHYHTRDRAWITYDSSQTRVQTTDAKYFTKIDLKRSLK